MSSLATEMADKGPRAVTSANDFDFRDLRKRPISIYARMNPDDIARLQPLLNLFFQQAIGLQTRELPEENPALRHQLLLVLDESRRSAASR